jgi:3-oxoacyl-[acyl-carrier-protein] synthase III
VNACHIAAVGAAAAERVAVDAIAADDAHAAALRATVGLEARHAPAGDIAPFELALDASRAVLDTAGLAPVDVDAIVQVGRMRVEYFSWGLSLALAKELGHPTALCLDVTEFTGPSLVAGLRLLGAKFHADDRLQTALLVFPHRFSDCVDMSATEDRWLWPLSDGAGALVIRRGAGPGAVLGHAFASDGTAARAIGLRTEVVDDGPEPDGFLHHEWALAKYYFVRDPDTWPSRVEARVAERLAATIEAAAARADVRLEDVSTVQTGFLYPGVAARLRERLRLGRRLCVHTAHGMMGGAELAFALPGLIADPELRDRPLALAGFGLPGQFGAVISTF